MGFYIRKGIRFGPLRFNISKSGVGLSFGTKGARTGTGPQGAYLHVGRNGVYYRRKIKGTVSHPKPADSATTEDYFGGSANPNENSVLDENAELSSKTALDEINARIAQKRYAPAIFQFTFVTSALFVISGFLYAIIRMQIYETLNVLGFVLFFVLAGIIFFAGYWISEAIEKHEISESTTLIQFDLDEATAREYKALSDAFRELSRTDKLWQILSDTPTWDSKRNAGATSLVKRVPIKVSTESLPFIETNVTVYGFALALTKLFFMPDQILVFSGDRFRTVDYASLDAHFDLISFVEDSAVPRDSRILDYRWRYARKDGGPDRRFSNNPRIPVVQYGFVELSSLMGLNLLVHVSDPLRAGEFVIALLSYIGHLLEVRAQGVPTGSSKPSGTSANSQHRTQTNFHQTGNYDEAPAGTEQSEYDHAKWRSTNKTQPKEGNPHRVLNISPNAEWEEIAAAYRRLVQMYHPDKVAGLAPEYQEIAEKKMKEINAAYSELKRHHRR